MSSSRSSSRSPPGVVSLPIGSGSEYFKFESHVSHSLKNVCCFVLFVFCCCFLWGMLDILKKEKLLNQAAKRSI